MRFQGIATKAAQLENVSFDDVCQIIIVHDVTPEIEEFVREKGIHLYWSYDL